MTALTRLYQINLDTKAHGGIAANSVIVNGHIDHIFNFEDVIVTSSGNVIYGNASANHIVSNQGAGTRRGPYFRFGRRRRY
ncbi:MAG: hypothetical protein R3D30_01040 [Hyphomicrobiales bacterium]